jgi:hypothetical protein
MASLDDILTTQKNGVIAINSYVNLLTNHAGSYSTKEVSASSVIKSSSGWLATVSVVVAGSTQGYLYDSNSTSSTSGNRIYAVPNTLGIYQVQIPFATGLVFVPGTGSIISVGYS